MSGYIGNISPIYHVSGGVDMIFRGEKSRADISINIAKISAIYRLEEINRRFCAKIASSGKISAIYRRLIGDKSSIF